MNTALLERSTEHSALDYDAMFIAMVENFGFSLNLGVTDAPPAGVEENVWQTISRYTNTIVTPANLIDALGFAGAAYGLQRLDSWKGISVTGVSFMADFADGKVARATGTQSELGEALDAAGDKVKLAFALYKVWQLDLAPKPLLVAIAAQNGLNAAMTVADRALNTTPVLHASYAGKRAIFAQQWGIGLHVIGSQMEKDEIAGAEYVKLGGTILGAAGVAVGAVATIGYGSKLFASLGKK